MGQFFRKLVDRTRKIIAGLPSLLQREIWSQKTISEETPQGKGFALLRILIIIWQGIGANKLFSQAAALSYYSLIGLGPLLAIGIMVSSFVLQRDEDSNLAVETLTRIIVFVAPPVAQWDEIEDKEAKSSKSDTKKQDSSSSETAATDTTTATNETAQHLGDQDVELNPQILQFINHIVDSARSGAVGVIGSLMLVFIVIQMITSIEKSFNGIWGVRRGRSWSQRIISYWAIISLGAVLIFTAITVLSASTIVHRFNEWIPWVQYEDIHYWAGPILSVSVLTLVLAIFNRYFPHTSVQWWPALVGGGVGAILLMGNHAISFLYVHKVIREQSLYGSVGIIPVLMFGLYLFWLIVLMAGQVTYAIQNANNLTNQNAWSNISTKTRESLSLACFLLIARRFLLCEPAPSSTELANHLRVPGQLINSCLTQMGGEGWVRAVEPSESETGDEVRYQPGKPLDKISLLDFRKQFYEYGNNSGSGMLDEIEPLLPKYRKGFSCSEDLRKPIAEILSNPLKFSDKSDD